MILNTQNAFSTAVSISIQAENGMLVTVKNLNNKLKVFLYKAIYWKY